MGKIATKGWINANKKPVSGWFNNNQCPTRSEIVAQPGLTILLGRSYADNQLVQEEDISYMPPEGLTIIGIQGEFYYISRLGYITTGKGWISPAFFVPGDPMSDTGKFEFGIDLYITRGSTGAQQRILPAHNTPGGTINLSI